MRAIAAALLGTIALSADAGLVYRFTSKSTAALGTNGGGRVWIDGDRKRVELDPDPSNPRTHDVHITANGKSTYINLQNKTYFHEHRLPPGARLSGSSSLFHLPTGGDQQIRGKAKVTYKNAGAGPTLGEYATVKHVIEFRYRLRTEIAGTGLHGDVAGTVTVFTAPALPRSGDLVLVRTTFNEVDYEVAKHLASFEGMVVGHELSVSRKLEGGPAVKEQMSMMIDELRTTDIDENLFAIPEGFTHREPQLGVPGT